MACGAVLAIGMDLCGVTRMEKAIAKEHFLARVFTQEERAHIAERTGRTAAERAAAYFAAKEAAAKALGTGFSSGVMPEQIGVAYESGGRPYLQLSGAAEEKLRELGGKEILLSLSHEEGMAAAFAVLVG